MRIALPLTLCASYTIRRTLSTTTKTGAAVRAPERPRRRAGPQRLFPAGRGRLGRFSRLCSSADISGGQLGDAPSQRGDDAPVLPVRFPQGAPPYRAACLSVPAKRLPVSQGERYWGRRGWRSPTPTPFHPPLSPHAACRASPASLRRPCSHRVARRPTAPALLGSPLPPLLLAEVLPKARA